MDGRRAIALAASAVAVSACAALALSFGSCGIAHVEITGGLASYERGMDPESCEELLDRIYEFNDVCAPRVEIVDCG